MADESIPVADTEFSICLSNNHGWLQSVILGAAHQLRNPLNSMSLRVELLRAEVGENGNGHIDKLRQQLSLLDETVETLLRFIGPAKLKTVQFDIKEMFNELATRVRSDGFGVELRIESGLPLIRADREMIYQALLNVITNAEEAMADGGVLMLSASHDADSVTVSVGDSGCGISPENLQKVFELYYTNKPDRKGMGLPCALRSVHLHGGTITMKSLVGQGTVCIIRLPIAPVSSTN
jgi:two-component system sensor histidine kinase HydH